LREGLGDIYALSPFTKEPPIPVLVPFPIPPTPFIPRLESLGFSGSFIKVYYENQKAYLKDY
jgi:hypothetical protein